MRKLTCKIKGNIYAFDPKKSKNISVISYKETAQPSLGIIVDTALKIPPLTGVTYRLFYLCRKLLRCGINIKIFACNRNIERDEDIGQLLNDSNLEFHIIPEKRFYNISEVEKIIAKNKIDILQFEDPVSVLRYYSIAEKLKLPIVLEMHDVESILRKHFKESSNKIILSRAISSIACQLSDIVITMTSFDFFELTGKEGLNPNKIRIIPNAIDFSEFRFYGPNLKQDNIIFVGNMFYEPNRLAAKYIATKISPVLIKNNKNIKFIFVGMAGDELKKLANPNLIFTGPVNNLNDVLSQATIAICPIVQGSGMKVKILNYCAAGLPIITTTLGASGYEKVSSLIVEDDLSAFPNAILKLLSRQEKLKEIGLHNYQLAKKYYNDNTVTKKLADVYHKLIDLNQVNKNILTMKKIRLPLPLWLQEGRVENIGNKSYYVVKNKKIKII